MIPDPEWIRRIEKIAGKSIQHVQPIQRGYTPAARWLVDFSGGSTAFAKIGTTPDTAHWLRKEQWVYESLHGSYMPQLLGWEDDEEHPILLLEDLRLAHWPPPWQDGQIRQVLDTLPDVWASSLPVGRIEDFRWIEAGWQFVADNPQPFLSLRLATEKWLAAALPTLLRLPGREIIRGDSLLHLDIRSDNLCFAGDRVVLIDWNLICLGNPRLDLGFWLPSLEAEGGPPPEKLLPGAGDIAGIVSGFYASRAGQPGIPDAPFVRHIQRVQLKTALPWAVRALGLPGLDGGGG